MWGPITLSFTLSNRELINLELKKLRFSIMILKESENFKFMPDSQFSGIH